VGPYGVHKVKRKRRGFAVDVKMLADEKIKKERELREKERFFVGFSFFLFLILWLKI